MENVPNIGDRIEYNGSKYRVTGWFYEYKKTYKFCSKEKATHVEGVGVCGCIVPITKIKILGKCNISDERIKHDIDLHNRLIGNIV